MSESLQDRVAAAVGHHYQIESEIGQGGMSVVYRARDLRLDRPVAIKVLPPELAHDAAVRIRFTREGQTSAHLAHAHIVPIYDVGDAEGIAYLVMAFATGGNLARLLVREPLQPITEVRRLLGEIADALAYAHARGVIHRDIKPDNILLDRESGRAMVTDFGIARAMEAGARLTVTGIAVGTPTYMSPEQAVGEREVDGRSDIYSLGVLAYQMVTGRVPFTAANPMALLLKHVSERPRPVAELRPDTPRALSEAIERALMKAPDDRWPTASAFREALTTDAVAAAPWRGAEPAVPRPSAPPPSSPPPSAPPASTALVAEPDYLSSLTTDQRADLRLWHGRVDLYDRIKAIRGYALLTTGVVFGGIAATIAGLGEGVPPAVLALVPPWYMSMKLVRRAKSLRAAGLGLRRLFLMPRAKWVLPVSQRGAEVPIEKLASRELLEGHEGAAIRRAVEDRAAILDILAKLPKADRALLPDMESTVNSLVDRIVNLAEALRRLDEGFDPRLIEQLDARIAELTREGASPDAERHLALLRRQRATVQDLVERRTALARQIDSAGLALGNLRLDLVRLRSTGLASALSGVNSATQEARALSREIGMLLEAVEEVNAG
ncbi:MAG TPA: serine/threonine-protein kinase [Gemmatimonadaceae bacterium]